MRSVLDSHEIYSVCSLEGLPRCWMCGEGDVAIAGRWCSVRCQMQGERMIAEDPTPAEIYDAASAIRATWSLEERARRRRGFAPDVLLRMLP